MKEELISFDTAKLTKEKGFDWKSLRFKGIIDDDSKRYENWNSYNNALSKPTQSLLQKWLREKNIDVISCPSRFTGESEIAYWFFMIKGFQDHTRYNSYEEALEKGLQEALKLI